MFFCLMLCSNWKYSDVPTNSVGTGWGICSGIRNKFPDKLQNYLPFVSEISRNKPYDNISLLLSLTELVLH